MSDGVVSHPDQLTPERLTQHLNRAGFSGSVTGFAWQSIGAGQVGDNARLALTGEGDVPETLVAKFPSSDPVSRQTGVELNNYYRECYFYSDLAQTLDVQTPTLFGLEFDENNHDFIILMQDLAPGYQIDQMDGCDAVQAEMALLELAKLHGPRWGDETLAEHPLLAPVQDTLPQPMYNMFEEGFLGRYSNRLSEAEIAMVGAVGEVITGYQNYQGTKTLIHIDYRLDNMIFHGPFPVAILDWQSINLGCALNDVAYFMGTSLAPELRAEQDERLLSAYFETLAGYSNVDLSWTECQQYYRWYAPAGLHMAVVASMLVGETERGNDMFMAMATRSIAMCRDLDTVPLLATRR